MSRPVTTKNNMLNGQTFTAASLHSAFPGSTGSNELSGGTPAYARKTITFGSASGGVRNLGGSVDFDVPATTVRWIGFWNGAAFVDCCPNGGATPKNFMATPATDLIHCTGHGWIDGQKVVFYNGSPPGGITEGTIYEVIEAEADAFKLTQVGSESPINLTASASFECVVTAITEDVYAAQGVHTLSVASVVFN